MRERVDHGCAALAQDGEQNGTGTPLAALIIEDVEDDALLLLRELRRGGYHLTYQCVETADAMRAALDSRAWDVVISDYTLPTFSAPAALEILHERGLDLPFIIVSGTIGEELAVAAMRAGARDYLMKGHLARLVPTIAREVKEAAARRARRLAEQTLRESESRYRAVVEQASDGIFLFDLQTGRILETNAAFEKLLGYTTAEIAGLTIHDILDQPQAAGSLQQILFEQSSTTGEWRYRRKDHSLLNVEVSASRIVYGGETVVCATVRDITMRKRRERELEVISTVNAALRLATTRAALLPIILDQVMTLLSADGAAIASLDPHCGSVVVELAHGRFGDSSALRTLIARSSENIIASKEPSVSNHEHGMTNGAAPHGEPFAIAGVPLNIDDYPIGALWMARAGAIIEEDLRLLAVIGEIAARSTHRATLYEQTRQRLHRLGALHEVQVAIGASLDLRITLSVLLDHVIAQLGVDAARVMLFNPHTQGLVYAASRGFRSGAIARVSLRIGEGAAGRVALERRAITVPDLGNTLRTYIQIHLPEGEDFHAYYGVPLIAKGQVKGVLDVFHRAPLVPDREWLDFLESLAAQAAVAIDNAALFHDLQSSHAALTMAYDTTLEGWSRALDLRDRETEGHTQRVTDLTIRLARAAGISGEELIHVRRGALLHDIGKMGIPDSILLKPGPLTEDEWQIMRRHPQYAYDLLSPISFLQPALDIPYCHHERWDGSGYPRRLAGTDIPLAARLFAVADVWDALRSDRPYRAAWPREQVRAHILSLAGAHFDPLVVDIFLTHMEDVC